MRPFSSFKRRTHVFEWTTYSRQKLIVRRCCLNSFNFGRLVISMIFQLTFSQNSSEKNAKITLWSFKRQKKTQLLKKGNWECVITCPKKQAKDDYVMWSFFEMPLNPYLWIVDKNPQTAYIMERNLWTKNPHKFFFKIRKASFYLLKQFSKNYSGKK